MKRSDVIRKAKVVGTTSFKNNEGKIYNVLYIIYKDKNVDGYKSGTAFVDDVAAYKLNEEIEINISGKFINVIED